MRSEMESVAGELAGGGGQRPWGVVEMRPLRRAGKIGACAAEGDKDAVCRTTVHHCTLFGERLGGGGSLLFGGRRERERAGART